MQINFKYFLLYKAIICKAIILDLMDFKPIEIVKIALKTISLTFKVPSEIVLKENTTSVNIFEKKNFFWVFLPPKNQCGQTT